MSSHRKDIVRLTNSIQHFAMSLNYMIISYGGGTAIRIRRNIIIDNCIISIFYNSKVTIIQFKTSGTYPQAKVNKKENVESNVKNP